MQGLQGIKIALLIDFDNVVLGVEDPGFDPELVVNALRSRGIVVMGRAYGDWYRHNRHRRKLMEQGIELVETPVFGPVIKNSADIRIVLDAFEIAMLQHHIDAFCLVSGDSDFLPLIKKLQYLGKHVIVIAGNKFTSDLVRRNCNEFISYENLLAESLGATEDVGTLEGALSLLARGISTLHERGMEVRSSTVKQMMLQLNPAFSERNFGCAQFKQFLDKAVRAGIVKLGERDHGSGEFMVFLPSDFDEEAPEGEAKTGETKTGEAKTGEAPVVAPSPNGKAKLPASPGEGTREASHDRRRDRDRRREREAKPTEAKPTAAPAARAPAKDKAKAAAEAPEDLGVELAEEVPTGEVKPITTSHLLHRGLRKGKLHFSGKTGHAQVAAKSAQAAPAEAASGEAAPEFVEIAAEVTEAEPMAAEAAPEFTVQSAHQHLAAPVEDEATSAPHTVETPEVEQEAQAEKAPEAESPAAEAAETPAELEAAAEATAEAASKKRVTRRGGKAAKAKAEKARAKAAKSEAAETPAETPAEPAPEPAPETAPETVAETPTEGAPSPVEVGAAAAEAKPARRTPHRRGGVRKKKPANGNGQTGNGQAGTDQPEKGQ